MRKISFAVLFVPLQYYDKVLFVSVEANSEIQTEEFRVDGISISLYCKF